MDKGQQGGDDCGRGGGGWLGEWAEQGRTTGGNWDNSNRTTIKKGTSWFPGRSLIF